MIVVPLDIVPDEDEADCAAVIVEATVADRTYRFILDTGAGTTHLVNDEYVRTLRVHGEKRSAGAIGPIVSATVVVPELTFGPVHVRDLECTVSEPTQPGARPLLAMDVLRDQQLEFCFDAGYLRFAPDPVSATWHRLTMDAVGHPYMEVAWPQASAMCVWDSGAGITVVNEQFFRRHSALFARVGTAVGTDASGATVETTTWTMDACTIGDHEFPPTKVAVVDLSAANAGLEIPMDMILGYTTLRHADWLFDFPNKRWTITRPPG